MESKQLKSKKNLGGRPRVLSDENKIIGVRVPIDYRDDFINTATRLNLSHSHLLRTMIESFVDHIKKKL